MTMIILSFQQHVDCMCDASTEIPELAAVKKFLLGHSDQHICKTHEKKYNNNNNK